MHSEALGLKPYLIVLPWDWLLYAGNAVTHFALYGHMAFSLKSRQMLNPVSSVCTS